MTEHEFVDAVELYEFARGWFAADIENPLPIPEWRQHVSDLQSSEEGPLGLYLGEKFAKPVNQSMIAVLAAISMGMPRHGLLKVIKQHDLTMKTVIQCDFADVNYGDEGDDEYVFVADEFNPVEMTPWHITNEIIQSVSLDSELSTKLADEYNVTDSTQNLSVAAALASNEAFWPSRRILQKLRTDTRSLGALEKAVPSTNILNSTVNLRAMPAADVIAFLERTGNLLPEYSSENGLETSFFRNVFIAVAEGYGKNLNALARALNSIEDKDLLVSLDTRLLQKLCDYDYDDHTGGLPVLRGIRMSLDEEKYPLVRNSMFFKLLVMRYEMLGKVNETWLDKFKGTGTDQFFTAPESIFSSLADELMDLDPQDFRRGHFLAITNFSRDITAEQNLDSVDMNAVLLKVMQGFEAYQSTYHYDYRGILHNVLKINAKNYVAHLIAWMTPRMKIDYSVFAKLESSSQAMLASAGFDIKQLPNMTRRDRGEVLSNQLGL